MKKYFTENYDIVKKQFLDDLISNSIKIKPDIFKNQLDVFHIPMGKVRILIIQCVKNSDNVRLNDSYYYMHMMVQYIKKKLGEEKTLHISGTNTYIIWPVSHENYEDNNYIITFVNEINRYMQSNYFSFVIAGCSKINKIIDNIRVLVKQANLCIEELKNENENETPILFYEDIESEEDSLPILNEELTALINAIQRHQETTICSLIERIFEMKQEDNQTNYYIYFTKAIFLNLSLLLKDIQLNSELDNLDIVNFEKKLQKMDDKRYIKEEIIKLCINTSNYFFKYQKIKNNYLVQEVYEFINNNYGRQISLTDLSGYIGRNPSYISRIIKQGTGNNFTDILTNKRILQAKYMLNHTNLKVYEVAERCGYPNTRYFNRVFMDKVGMTANDYRKLARTLIDE